MKKVLISYGNEAYYDSLERIRKEGESLGIFDKIVLYTDKDLPEFIKRHELFSHKRGGGYWVWKPWIVLHTMEELDDDDIVIYADAGCQLFKSDEWNEWFDIMKSKNGLFFSYGGTMKQFCKKQLLNTSNLLYLQHFYQLQGGLFFIKKRIKNLMQECLDLMIYHPEYVLDVPKSELNQEFRGFLEHRHDQAVFSVLVYGNLRKYNLMIKWQHIEFLDKRGQAVYAARIRNGVFRRGKPSYESLLKRYVKKFLLTPYRSLKMGVLTKINYKRIK